MKKELNAISLDFTVELLVYSKRNAFPGRKGKSAMCCFDGDCDSFEVQGQFEDCHYYGDDYQGNNLMVVNINYERENSTGSTFVVGQ